ncbi:hypothetical protein L9F63_008483, partial [Diploptera punctata]
FCKIYATWNLKITSSTLPSNIASIFSGLRHAKKMEVLSMFYCRVLERPGGPLSAVVGLKDRWIIEKYILFNYYLTM